MLNQHLHSVEKCYLLSAGVAHPVKHTRWPHSNTLVTNVFEWTLRLHERLCVHYQMFLEILKSLLAFISHHFSTIHVTHGDGTCWDVSNSDWLCPLLKHSVTSSITILASRQQFSPVFLFSFCLSLQICPSFSCPTRFITPGCQGPSENLSGCQDAQRLGIYSPFEIHPLILCLSKVWAVTCPLHDIHIVETSVLIWH